MKSFKFKSDEELIQKATEIFEKLGLSLDSALNLFLKQSVLKNGLPFQLVLSEEAKISEPQVEDDSKLSVTEQLEKIQKQYTNLLQQAMSENKVKQSENLGKKIEEIKTKLANNFKNIEEQEKNAISDEAKENLKNRLQEIKSKLAEVQKIEAEKTASNEAAKENLRQRLEEIKNRAAISQKAEEEAAAQAKKANEDLLARLEQIKNKLFDDKQPVETPTTSTVSEEIAERVRQNEELTRQARVEEGVSEKYIMAETQQTPTVEEQKAEESQPEEEVPTVSSIVQETAVKETATEKVAHEEDEDETAPENMFASWDDEEEVGCGC